MISTHRLRIWNSTWTNPHALTGTLALTKHTNDFDTDTDWEWLSNQILTTINQQLATVFHTNMEYLLDTHALLWLFSDHPLLSQRVRNVFLDPQTKLLVSSISFWEITIKWSLGRIELRDGWLQGLEKERMANDINWLDIKQTHLDSLMQLPFLHQDPFDRLLIAQAQAEGMILVTADPNIHKYNIPCLW